MKTINNLPCFVIFCVLFVAELICAADGVEDKVPLRTKLPPPPFMSAFMPTSLTNMEPPLKGARPDLLVPFGTTNLATGKKVTASSKPIRGTLDLVNDGQKFCDDNDVVEFGPGKQWVQIDLEKEATIYGVFLWHYYADLRVYSGVVLQVSDDREFKADVATIFNNDINNTLGLGAGKDYNYVESYAGKLFDTKGINGRYIRLYSNGNTSDKSNHYIEVEVFGKPAAASNPKKADKP